MTTKVGVLEIDKIVGVLQRRCESMDVRLIWDPHVSTAMTNGRTITLPSIKAPVTKEAMEKLYGFVIHEAGHHGRPEAFDILNSARPSEALSALYNICEDDGMERSVAQAYHGDAIALGQMNNVILGEIVEHWKSKEYEIPDGVTETQLAPIAVCGLSQLSRLEWDGMSTSSRAAYFRDLHPTAAKLLNDLIEEGWIDKLRQTKTAHDTWDTAVDLFKRLYPHDEEQEQQTEDTRAKGHAKSSSGQDSDGDAGSGGEDTGASNKGEGSPPPDAEGSVVSWKDAVLSEHNEWSPKEDGATPGSIGIDWTDYGTGDVGLMPAHEVNVLDCRTRQYAPETEGRWGNSGTPEAFMPDNTQARAFGNQIRRYLQAQTRTKVAVDKYHGRLDKGSLVKLALPPIDGGEYNKKLFYQMDRERNKNTAIHVLTDWSGSMMGSKMVYAADASGRLVQVFDKVLHMPVQLAAFTNGRTKCDIGLIKGFNDRTMTPLDIATAFSRFYKFSSANNDADSVMWAYRQLLARKEERKILIVLSDGCPAGSYVGSSHACLQYVTRAIEKTGKVELYGVGICSDSVKEYYTNYKVLEDEHDINNTLFEIIKEGSK